MALKQLPYGTFKSGKSIYVLSLAVYLTKFSKALALADTEYAHDWYLMPHPLADKLPPFSTKSKLVVTATFRPPLLKLFGIDPESDPATWPVVYWLRSQDLGQITGFIIASGKHASVGGIGIDSLSVIWDLASDTVEDAPDRSGGLAWKEAKKLMRRFQYDLLSTELHYICTSHQQISYNAQMMITGEGPWTEKKVPHWLDLIGRLEFNEQKGYPIMTVTGERSSGLLKRKDRIEAPTFEKVLNLFAGNVPERSGISLDADEIEYRNRDTVSKLGKRS